jgi:TetR/AcrR family transcriptional repressor of nem operon
MATVPSTDRGRASRERIIDVACDLFYRHGVHATGLEQIAKASGTGKGQLYHYFGGKSDLVRAVVERQVERVLAAQEPFLGEMKAADDLRAWAEQLATYYEQRDDPVRCPIGALAVEMADEDPTLRGALDVGFTRWRESLASGLQRLVEAGDVAPGSDLDELAELLLGAYEGGVLLSQVRGDTASLRILLGGAVRQVLGPQPTDAH